MVYLLQTIAFQNYSISPFFVNATSLPTPFNTSVPDWALWVNGLWFASLVVSLATASLGMLVQSWLREYLAGEWISPQEKLRARQYRHPAMEHWRVFEIAAALPLLLQVALGLFFLGLCFFTEAVDPRMGDTTIPIVGAWAFFFLMTTLAPLLSPRCPFKVLLLKDVMRLGRKYLMPFLFAHIRRLRSLFIKQERPIFPRGDDSNKNGDPQNILSHYSYLERFYAETQQAIENLDKPGDAAPTKPGSVSHFITRSSLITALRLAEVFRLYVIRGYVGDEEDIVVTRTQDDIETLLATDRIMANDGLLDTMRDAVKQSGAKPETLMYFVVGLIKHRAVSVPEAGKQLDLRRLSRQAYTMITELVVHALSTWDLDQEEVWSPVQNACAILAADSEHDIPDLRTDDKLVRIVCKALELSKPEPGIAACFVLRVVNSRLDALSATAPSSRNRPDSFSQRMSADLFTLLVSTTFKLLKAEENWVEKYSTSSWGKAIGALLVADYDSERYSTVRPAVFDKDDTTLMLGCEIVERSQLNPRSIIDFVMHNIRSRAMERPEARNTFDLSKLPPPVYVSLRTLLLHAIITIASSPRIDGIDKWLEPASGFLISKPPPMAPPLADHASVVAVCNEVNRSRLGPLRMIEVAEWALSSFGNPLNVPQQSKTQDMYNAFTTIVILAITRLGSLGHQASICLERALNLFPLPPLRSTIKPTINNILDALDMNQRHWMNSPTYSVQFTLQVLQLFVVEKTSGPVFQLEGLSDTNFQKLIGAIASTLRPSERGAPLDDRLKLDAVLALLSSPSRPLPPIAHAVLCELTSDALSIFWKDGAMEQRLIEHRPIPPLASRLVPVYTDYEWTPQPAIGRMLRMYSSLLPAATGSGYRDGAAGPPLWDLIKPHLYRDLAPSSPQALLLDIFAFVDGCLRHEVKRIIPSSERDGTMECLYILVGLRGPLGKKIEAAQVVRQFWETWAQSYRVLALFSILHPNPRIPVQEASECMADTFLSATEQCMSFPSMIHPDLFGLISIARRVMLQNSTEVARMYTSGAYDDGMLYDPIDMVTFCSIHLMLYQQHASAVLKQSSEHAPNPDAWKDGSPQPQIQPQSRLSLLADTWSMFWQIAIAALTKYHDENLWAAPYYAGSWHDAGQCAPQANLVLELDCHLARDAITRVNALVQELKSRPSATGGDIKEAQTVTQAGVQDPPTILSGMVPLLTSIVQLWESNIDGSSGLPDPDEYAEGKSMNERRIRIPDDLIRHMTAQVQVHRAISNAARPRAPWMIIEYILLCGTFVDGVRPPIVPRTKVVPPC